MNSFLIAVFLCFTSLTIYKIAYWKGPFYLRVMWIVALIVAVRSWILQ